MPWRRRWIAATRSSRSVTSASRRCRDLVRLLLGAEVDAAEPLALLPVALEPRLDVVEVGERRVRLQLGDLRAPPPARSRAPRRCARPISASRSPGGDDALLGAAALLARLGERLERRARRLVGCGERRLADGERVGRRRRATVSASSISESSARRFSSILRRLLGEPDASRPRPRPRRAVSVAICASALAPRSCQFWRSTAIAGEPAARGARPRAARLSTAARASASAARSSADLVAEAVELARRSCPARGVAASAGARRRRGRRRLRRGDASRRARASSRALRRAAMRPPRARRRRAPSRAASSARCAWRQRVARLPLGLRRRRGPRRSPASRSARFRGDDGALPARPRPCSVGEAVAGWRAAARPRSALGGGDVAVPAPEVALAADEPLAGLEQRLQARARRRGRRGRSGRAGGRAPPAPRHARRSGSTPSGSAGSSARRIDADASGPARRSSTGASRSSPKAAPSAAS